MPAAIPIAAAVASSAISADASRSAANTQADAANRAADVQQRNFQQTRQDLQPYMQGGNVAQNKLNQLLGLDNFHPFQMRTASDIRNELLPQYTKQQAGYDPTGAYAALGTPVPFSTVVDENGLSQAIKERLAQQDTDKATYDAQHAANLADPSFGSLLKPFDAKAFNQYLDPGYQFQLQQGQQALQNSQAAQNGVLSGSALKDLIGFNQGMASTAYSNAFGRYMSQNDATFSRLSNILGIGENAAAGAGNMGVQTGANVGNALMSGGSALAAGRVGQANAFSGALNTGAGYYMLNNMMNGGASAPAAGSEEIGVGLPFMGAAGGA